MISKLRTGLSGLGKGAEKQLAVLARQIIEHPQGVQLVPELRSAIQSVNSKRFFEPKIVSAVVANNLSDSSRIVAVIQGKDSETLKGIITYGSDDQFVLFLQLLCDFLSDVHGDLPEAIVRVIPEIEVRITKLELSPASIGPAMNAVGRLKLTNESVFSHLISAILKIESRNLGKVLRPAHALKLLREMGFAGYTHSALMAHVAPLFSGFKQYQALSSVWLLAGGLTDEIVRICMKSVRGDLNRKNDPSSRHQVSVQGHSQIIRRLVVCGYLEEAMELFRHFAPSEYSETLLHDNLSASQIQRFFLASFLDPKIVVPEEVEFLKPVSGRHEIATVMYTGGEPSSFIHALAVKALKKLEIEHISEHVDEPTQLMMDIFVPNRNLVIEIQGPSHYITDLASGETKLRPEDEFKISVLKARGYQVGILSVFDFGRNHATRNAEKTVDDFLSKFPLVDRTPS